MAETISNIGVHHFAGNLTLAQVEATQAPKWPDLPSKLHPNLHIGYNFIIWKDGTFFQSRYIGEETAAQVGHNFDTISICLAGDFSVGKDIPTEAQKATLKHMIQTFVSGSTGTYAVLPGTVLKIPQLNIFPHRVLQPNHTECYGSSLKDTWARDLAFPPVTQQPTPVVPASAPAAPVISLDVPALPALPSTGPTPSWISAMIFWCQKVLDALNARGTLGATGLERSCLTADVRG